MGLRQTIAAIRALRELRVCGAFECDCGHQKVGLHRGYAMAAYVSSMWWLDEREPSQMCAGDGRRTCRCRGYVPRWAVLLGCDWNRQVKVAALHRERQLGIL